MQKLRYLLRIRGTLEAEPREFAIAMGKAAQGKHQFQAGDRASGLGVPVADTRIETADLYKVSELRVDARRTETSGSPPPFPGVPPALEVYRERGRRRLAAVTAARTIDGEEGCQMPSVRVMFGSRPPWHDWRCH